VAENRPGAGQGHRPLGEKIMTEKPSHICTECLSTGTPSISYGRLFIEFITNLFLSSSVPFYQKVRHCSECGSHSIVSIESEAGDITSAKRTENNEIQTKQNDREDLRTASKSDDEYMRIRLQR